MRAIVTGATSGIGLACRSQLLQSGARVAGLDIRPEASLSEATDYRHIVFDLASVDSVRRAVDEADEWLGGVNVLLHFAAIWTPLRWDDIDEAEWSRVCEANLRGTFFLSQAVARRMVASRSGSIVLTGSDSVNMGGVAGGAAYVASKGGVIALTRALARALAPHGVRVNAINPGVIDTPMTAGWRPEVKQEVTRQTPLGRLGTPDEVASVAMFLASDAARFVTGEVVEVNGGFYFG